MRKACLTLVLLACLFLTGCARDPVGSMAQPDAGAQIPSPSAPADQLEENTAVLWFRYGQEPYLAAETRRITSSAMESDALALLSALVQGPSAASTELSALFPAGTKVQAAYQADDIMFVTLSHHLLNAYADEPKNWRNDPAWADEVPLRRTLAMQAIAATATENFHVDKVVILVEQKDTVTDSLRLRQSYFTLADDMTLAEPLIRDESLLLTPARTAEVILTYWQQADWSHLYRYIAAADPVTGQRRPDEAAFIAQMEQSAHLLYASAQGGSISSDGRSAVFTVQGAWLDHGAESPFSGMVLRLVKEKGMWRIGASQLAGRGRQP